MGSALTRSEKRISSAIFGVCMVLAFITVLISSDIAIDYMKKGLRLCSDTVIPSLFPFMVISELIVSSGAGVRISRLLSKPMSMLFGIGQAGAVAYILGAVCGFPIGAKTAVSMYDKGIMSKRELEQVLTFCNNPGSAFVISAVGVSLFGRREVGILLYVCGILSSVAVGFFTKFFFKSKDTVRLTILPSSSRDGTVESITGAIQSSATAMLYVCAYVVFFSALIGCIGAFLHRFGAPEWVIACIFGFFEISSGVGAGSEVSVGLASILLCALFLGWSGLSVHFQIMTVCSGRGISFKPYFIAKAAQGVICAALTGIGLKCFFPALLEDNFTVYLPQAEGAYTRGGFLCLSFFAASVAILAVSRIFEKNLKNNSKKYLKRY